MPMPTGYQPSTDDEVRQQVARYELTGGREGSIMMGRPVVILTTIGARSGARRKCPIMRFESAGVYAAVASVGGLPKNPGWYHNLRADPSCQLQDGPDLQDALARSAVGEEYRRWWDRAVAAFPHYGDLQAKTARTIPILLLEPAGRPH